MITSSESVHERRRFGADHQPEIKYKYKVGKSIIENDVITFGYFRGFFDPTFADRTVSTYPVGKRINVYYSPDEPSVACLEPGVFSLESWGLLAVGLAGLIWFFWKVLMLIGRLFRR